MPLYTYISRVTGKIAYRSMTPLSVDQNGSITIRVNNPNTGEPMTFSEGMDDGSVRRGVRGQGLQLTDSEGGRGGGANVPTWAPSDFEMP